MSLEDRVIPVDLYMERKTGFREELPEKEISYEQPKDLASILWEIDRIGGDYDTTR